MKAVMRSAGFSRSMSNEQIVSSDDLQVGDNLVGFIPPDGVRRTCHMPWNLKQVDSHKVHMERVVPPGRTWDSRNTFYNSRALQYIISRSSGNAVPVIAAAISLADYPHTCTRCGRPAYIGLNETDHADENAARGCPAPRARKP